MRTRSLLLVAPLLLLPAGSAAAQTSSVSYEVTIESPSGAATGTVPLRVRVAGGVRDAKQAAFHLRTAGAWQEGERIQMTRVADNLFEATLDTTVWENASYRLEVRVWGDVPPYDPDNARTYARATGDVAVDNPPATPQRVEGVSPSSALRIGWSAVPAADRADFAGYRVFSRKGATCPAELSAYRALAFTDQLLYVDGRVAPGRYCFRVASVRFSAVSGEILSPPSAPVRVLVERAAGGGIGVTTGEPPAPPPPPVLGEGTVEVSDGAFAEDLPYDPQTVTEVAPGEAEESAREAGVDPRRTPTLVALGLVLAVTSFLIQQFLGPGTLPS